MPRKNRFTREEILASALDLTREKGIAAVTARGLGERLGTSSKPVFGQFENMEAVQRAVFTAAEEEYNAFLREDMAAGKYQNTANRLPSQKGGEAMDPPCFTWNLR